MEMTQITKAPTATPVPTKPEAQPAVEPNKTREEVLDQIAMDAFVDTKEYLNDAIAPQGE